MAGKPRNLLRIKNRRQGGRVPVENAMTDLGEVVDISPTGICILTRKRLSGKLSLKIFHHGGTIVVECEVVRSERCGLFKREIGMRFMNPPQHVAATLAEIARSHSKRAA